MTKIGIFLENYTGGGVDTVIVNTINAWPFDDEFVLICNASHPGLEGILIPRINKPITVRTFPFKTITELLNASRPGVARKLLKGFYFFGQYLHLYLKRKVVVDFLKSLKLDHIFIHNGGYPGAPFARLAAICANNAGLASAFMVIHSTPVASRFINRFVENKADSLIDARAKVICVSHSARTALYEKRKFSQRISVVHNGISGQSLINGSMMRAFNVPSQDVPLKIVMIGCFDKGKGHEFLFQALASFNRRYKIPFSCSLIGSGLPDQVAYIKSLIDKYDLIEKVELLGFQNDVSRFLCSSHIFVFPSVAHESFPMTIIEAMSCGVPCIASDIGGVSEMIDENTGLLVKPGDFVSLSDKLHFLAVNPGVCSKLSKASKEKAEAYFSAQYMCEQYASLLQNSTVADV